MARRWTFGTDKFGTLVTAAAPHLLDSGQLQEAENVCRDVAGQLSPSATDLTIHTTGVDIYGMRVARYGGATHVIYAGPFYLYVDGVQIGASGGPVTHRFVCDGERVYIFDGVQPKVWDGTTLRNHGPFGSAWANVTNDAETMMVTKEGSSGTPAGIAGVYKWAASYRATLESGQVIESKLYPLWIDAGGDPDDNYAGSITMVTTDGAILYIRQVTQAEVDAWCPDLGTGKIEGVLWRTKAGTPDYWQQSVVAQADIVGLVGRHQVYDTVKDADLGAEYLGSMDAHGVPPAADVAVFCQRRLFVAITGERKLYFSGIDNYDYFKPTDNVDAEETIEGLAVLGENVAVVTATGIRLWSPVDEVGQWSNSSSSVGTVYKDSLVNIDQGLLFARQDGMYLFDGVSSRRVSEAIDATWQQFDSPNSMWRGASSNGFGFFTNSLIAVEFKIVGGSFSWSTSDAVQSNQAVGYLSDDPLDAGVWSSHLDGTIRHMHQGTGLNTMTVKTKDFGDGATRHWDRLVVDFSGDLSAVVLTNRGATQTVALSSTGRLRDREMLLATMIGELANATFTGTGTLHGVELETT